jgi:phage shock protein A
VIQIAKFSFKADFEDQSNLLRAVDDKCIKAMQEVSKLKEELMNEQEKYQMEMNQRKTAESKIKEQQVKAENAELSLAQGGKKLVERLGSKVRDLEEELEAEKRHSRDAIKMSRHLERNCKDMEYQYQEEKRNYERLEVKNNDVANILYPIIMFRTWFASCRTKQRCTRGWLTMQRRWQVQISQSSGKPK